jgi:hypothetical protein
VAVATQPETGQHPDPPVNNLDLVTLPVAVDTLPASAIERGMLQGEKRFDWRCSLVAGQDKADLTEILPSNFYFLNIMPPR